MVFHGVWLVPWLIIVFGWFPWFFKVVSWFFMVFGWFLWFLDALASLESMLESQSVSQ